MGWAFCLYAVLRALNAVRQHHSACSSFLPLLALILLAWPLTPFLQVCCMRPRPQMTGLWYLSEAVLPESLCPACSSEELLHTQPQMCHSWSWAHPRRFSGRSPHQAQVQEGSPGIYPSSQTLHGQPREEMGVQKWGGVLSTRAAQGVRCYL